MPHAKETGGGHERPNHCTHYEPPFSAPGEHILDAASEHPCLQPSDSLPKLVEEGESPPCLRVSPMPLAFLFIFLMYCLFPCIKGDLPLTLWANLLATD